MDWASQPFKSLNSLLISALQDPSLHTKQLHSSLIAHRNDLKWMMMEPTTTSTTQTLFDGIFLFLNHNTGKVFLDGREQQVNEAYKLGVALTSKWLNLDGKRAASLYQFALSQFVEGGSSIMEIVLYTYFMERESLLGTLEILVQYGNSSNLNDPNPTINRALHEVFGLGGGDEGSHSPVEKLIDLLIEHEKAIENLTPLPSDSTTQERDRIISLGAKASEIDVYSARVSREVGSWN